LDVTDVTTDPNKPEFELADHTDPETGLPLSYKVTFSNALKSLMSYSQGKITTEVSTLDSGKKPGIYSILVETTCNGEVLSTKVQVQLRESLKGLKKLYLDYGATMTRPNHYGTFYVKFNETV